MNFWQTLKKPILALAPMEGVTDQAFRRICKDNGADVVYTEFISADALAYRGKTALRKMQFDENERPVICQIFGHDPQHFTAAAKMVEAAGFDGLDINFGCPARKVVGSGSGVAILRDPQFARQLIEAALSAVSIPVSIKVRTKIRKERKEIQPGAEYSTALDLVAAIRDLPVAAIMVHGRAFEAGHSGSVDTDMIRQVKEQFPGLVLANGGITKPHDVVDMLRETSADGVGIARGAWGQPWIFRQSRQLLDTGRVDALPFAEVLRTLRQHAQYAFETKGPHGLIEFRKHAANYIHGRPGAAALRRDAVQISTLDDVDRLIARIPT